jgi:hypothetical protein
MRQAVRLGRRAARLWWSCRTERILEDVLLRMPGAKKKGVALRTPLRAQIQNFADELHRKACPLHTVSLGTFAHRTGPPSGNLVEHHKTLPALPFVRIPIIHAHAGGGARCVQVLRAAGPAAANLSLIKVPVTIPNPASFLRV